MIWATMETTAGLTRSTVSAMLGSCSIGMPTLSVPLVALGIAVAVGSESLFQATAAKSDRNTTTIKALVIDQLLREFYQGHQINHFH